MIYLIFSFSFFLSFSFFFIALWFFFFFLLSLFPVPLLSFLSFFFSPFYSSSLFVPFTFSQFFSLPHFFFYPSFPLYLSPLSFLSSFFYFYNRLIACMKFSLGLLLWPVRLVLLDVEMKRREYNWMYSWV